MKSTVIDQKDEAKEGGDVISRFQSCRRHQRQSCQQLEHCSKP